MVPAIFILFLKNVISWDPKKANGFFQQVETSTSQNLVPTVLILWRCIWVWRERQTPDALRSFQNKNVANRFQVPQKKAETAGLYPGLGIWSTGSLFYAFGSATFPATVPTLLAKSVPKHHHGRVFSACKAVADVK